MDSSILATLSQKLLAGTNLIRNGRYTDFVAILCDKYQSKVRTYPGYLQLVLLFPAYILEELHLLLDERALAYPLPNGDWQTVRLPQGHKGRRIPVLFRTVLNTRHGSPKHVELIKDIYSYDGFVEIEPGDTVVDVGAFIGALSFAFADSCECMLAIDPMGKKTTTLEYNLQSYPSVTVVPRAAWNEETQIEINMSELPNENSILEPDQKQTHESFVVESDTVPNLVRDCGISSIDYLKIEAEGVEPEILEGALNDDMIINKIAVDASPERENDNIVDQVCKLLEENGYEWRINKDAPEWGSYIVFARLAKN